MKQFSWFLLLGFSDDDVCADRPKVLECFHKMTSTAQNPDGSLMSIGFPVLNATQFEQQCRAGDVWNKCVNEKNLRQSCAKDLLFVQADGSTGYICREPQKSVILSKVGCETQAVVNVGSNCDNATGIITGGVTPTDHCKILQDTTKCVKEGYIKACGMDYYNIFANVQESLVYPLNKSCKLERANGNSKRPEAAAACTYVKFINDTIEQRTVFYVVKSVLSAEDCGTQCGAHPFCQSAIYDWGNCAMSFRRMNNCNGNTTTTGDMNAGKSVVLGCFTCS